MRSLATTLASLSVLLIGYGYAPDIHRSADAIALLRPLFGVTCLLGLFATRVWMRGTFGLAALVTLASIAALALPQPPGPDLRLYSKDLYHSNQQVEAVVADIREAGADVIMLQEMTEINARIIKLLAEDFPHQHVCRFSGRLRIAVVSRIPFAGDGLCTRNRALAAVQVMLNSQKVWMVSVHIPWPWPTDTAETEAEVEAFLAALNGPIVVAGDFNSFPWTPRVQRIARITDTQLAGPMRPTFHLRGVPLPIDHVLSPGGGSVSLRPKLGSNHRGLVANISFEP